MTNSENNMKQNYKCILFSIVNNKSVFEEFLDNIKNQVGIDYHMVPCMNLNNEFIGARQAFNSVLEKSDGEYAVFLHPDIRFLTKTTLQELLSICDSISEFGVIGVAGCPEELENGKRIIYSTIKHGAEKKQAGRSFLKPIKVQTVDECLFIMKMEFVKQIGGFTDEEGWHLYAVEQCLRTIEMGLNNYVVPANIWHLSDGKSLDPSYVKQINRLIKKYGNSFDVINTTVKSWKTKGVSARIYRVYYYYKQTIKRILKYK